MGPPPPVQLAAKDKQNAWPAPSASVASVAYTPQPPNTREVRKEKSTSWAVSGLYDEDDVAGSEFKSQQNVQQTRAARTASAQTKKKYTEETVLPPAGSQERAAWLEGICCHFTHPDGSTCRFADASKCNYSHKYFYSQLKSMGVTDRERDAMRHRVMKKRR
eukprot:scaffold33616_cov27-Prasinocladus_malaysianus.AAC.1